MIVLTQNFTIFPILKFMIFLILRLSKDAENHAATP